MTTNFTNLLKEGLEEGTPMEKFKINTNYKHSLIQATKELIKERDKLKKEIKSSPNKRKVIHARYKKLRNRVTNYIRGE